VSKTPGRGQGMDERDTMSLVGNELGAFELTEAQVRAARLTVADRAEGADDCKLLLDACGLLT
jgi:hypothetical protein